MEVTRLPDTASMSCELTDAYVITNNHRIYSMLDNNHKIPMDCGKFHMTQDVTILLS